MNKKITVLAVFLLAFLVSGVAFAADMQITNKAGFDFYEVHFAQMSSANWGEDVLNMNVILNNETVTVHWNKGEKTSITSWWSMSRAKNSTGRN